MGAVGLLYVGAVLFLNGLMLLGVVEGRSAAPLNFFVGGLQVVVPTTLLITADGDPARILGAAGLYLFGFTYLYVALGQVARLDTSGVGWFSLFVAVAALAFAWVNYSVAQDNAFAVIWLSWAFLWGLFFVLLGLKRERLTRYTGWVTLIQGWVTAAIPAYYLLVEGALPGWYALTLAVFEVVVFAALVPLTMRRHEAPVEPQVGSGAHAQPRTPAT